MLKQVIVLRKDLGMRKGKMVAQGAHASLKAFMSAKVSSEHKDNASLWLLGSQTKICLGVDSEQELIMLLDRAKAKKLPWSLIKDAGYTELEPGTTTALAIGPEESDEIDEITGHLSLL